APFRQSWEISENCGCCHSTKTGSQDDSQGARSPLRAERACAGFQQAYRPHCKGYTSTGTNLTPRRMDVSEETYYQAYGAGAEWIRGRDGSKIRQETYPSPEQETIPKDRGV
ncbi:unnamed protein product, partial [Ectocarpus sp. 13 AM-2016]